MLSEIIAQGRSMSFKKLKEYIEDCEKVLVLDYAESADILGWCDIRRMKIGVNPLIRNTSRELFILAHEYGHFILHQKLVIGQKEYDNFLDPEYNFKTGRYDLTNPKNWIEWQANYFASSLIIPKVQFLARLWWCQDRLSLRRGLIYLDDQYSNRQKFNELITKMAYILNVSKTTIIYKLKEMELIEDNSRTKSIGQIISEYRSDFII
jgi:Zn-dependent peptidase ImmA (M78 family)